MRVLAGTLCFKVLRLGGRQIKLDKLYRHLL